MFVLRRFGRQKFVSCGSRHRKKPRPNLLLAEQSELFLPEAELFPAEYLYQDDDFVDRLAADLKLGSLPQEKRRALTERYSWTVLAGEFNKLFVSGDILRHMDVEKS